VILARLAATTSLFLGAFCPVGLNALAHAVNSAHIHEHDDGTVHAHEHDAEGHDEHEVRHTDDAPRIIAAVTRFPPNSSATGQAPAAGARAAALSPLLAAVAIHDPPLPPPQRLAASPSAGRAPPA